MTATSPRFQALFFELYESLPRQGPGNRDCTARALALCTGLPPAPAIIDLGCGVGAQTLHLAELTAGAIVALDSHAPSIDRLRSAIGRRGLEDRVTAIVGDMAHARPTPGCFDLVWSEGALYSIGLARALRVCRDLLRPGGCLAFTDAVWRTDHPAAEVKAAFDADYPCMGRVADDLATIESAGLAVVGHFTLPDAAWWDDFYTPMQARIADLREKYAADAAASRILDRLAEEPEMHRRHHAAYAYEFFVARKPSTDAADEP